MKRGLVAILVLVVVAGSLAVLLRKETPIATIQQWVLRGAPSANNEDEGLQPLIIPKEGLDNDQVLQSNFRAWAIAYQKKYSSVKEELKRFSIFTESVKKVVAHNAKRLGGGSSHRLGLTSYADWTDEEFATHFQFFPKRECWSVGDREQMKASNDADLFGDSGPRFLPRSIDWREKGIVTPVKNQGRCGSCWAFSAIGAIEAQYAKKYGKQILFSEQQLLDCSYGYGNFGCNGGFPSRAMEYVRRSGGLNAANTYPYEMMSNGTETCRFRKSDAAVQIHRVVNVTEADEHALQRAVAFAGPVTVAFVVASDFRLYQGGVYSTEECGKPKPQDLTHAVLIVGYGVAEEDGKKYWIVKNSWGDKWGIGGYFMIERGRNMCGISDCAAYAILE